MDIEATFVGIFGRSPTDAERRNLEQLSGSWAVNGNDALLAVLFVLELGAGFRRYPALCAESVRRSVRDAVRGRGPKVVTEPRQTRTGVAERIFALLAMVGTALVSLHAGASHTSSAAERTAIEPKGRSTLDMTPPVAATLAVLPPFGVFIVRRLKRLRARSTASRVPGL